MTKVPDHRPPPSPGPPPPSDEGEKFLEKKSSKEFKYPPDKKDMSSKEITQEKDKQKIKPHQEHISFDKGKHKHNSIEKKKEFFPDKHADVSFDKKKPTIPDKQKDKSSIPFDIKKKSLDEKKLSEEESKKETKEKKKEPEEKVPVTPFFSKEAQAKPSEAQEVKTPQVSAVEGTKTIEQIKQVILRMADTLRTGTIGEKTVHQVDLKRTTDVPSFLQGASVMVTREAPGKISVSISNLSDTNTDMTIKAIESQKAQLERLVKDLEAKQISITELKVGNHIIALPPAAVAPPPPLATGGFEGYREGGREQGGGGRGGREGGSGEQKGERERR